MKEALLFKKQAKEYIDTADEKVAVTILWSNEAELTFDKILSTLKRTGQIKKLSVLLKRLTR